MNRRNPYFRSLTVAVSLIVLNACDDSGPDTASAEGVPALIQVAVRGDLDALNALLHRRPEPDIRDLCDVLLGHGAHATLRDYNGRSASDWAEDSLGGF